MIRAFVALELPETIRQRLNLLQFLLPAPRRVPPENLHLTLAFLGHIPETVAEEVHFALAALRAPPFELTLAGVGLFGGESARVLWAGVRPEPRLEHLARKVETAVRRAGAPPESRRFTPHVTLARLKPGDVDPGRLERAVVDQAGFSAGPFRVADFVLYESHLGEDQAHYTPLARYALA